MFKGWFAWKAAIVAQGFDFTLTEWKPAELVDGVDFVTVDAPEGQFVVCKTHFTTVDSQDSARAISHRITVAAINRITFRSGTPIQEPEYEGHDLAEINPKPGPPTNSVSGAITFGFSVKGQCRMGLSTEIVKELLERPQGNGDQCLGMYRDASLCPGDVEKYMHLYNLLLMLFDDKQHKVDTFILKKKPQTPFDLTKPPMDPSKPYTRETLFTRFRNEFAHVRKGASMADTKEGMATNWWALKEIVKLAIEER